MEAALAGYRPLSRLAAPATLDGGDVLRVGRRLFAGATRRTNREGIDQLGAALAPFGYSVTAVPVDRCLHLKSAVTQMAEDAVLVNPDWVDAGAFARLEALTIDPSEPAAANTLLVPGALVVANAYPRTAERLQRAGLTLVAIDMSELAKAEGALTCCSLLLGEGTLRSRPGGARSPAPPVHQVVGEHQQAVQRRRPADHGAHQGVRPGVGMGERAGGHADAAVGADAPPVGVARLDPGRPAGPAREGLRRAERERGGGAGVGALPAHGAEPPHAEIHRAVKGERLVGGHRADAHPRAEAIGHQDVVAPDLAEPGGHRQRRQDHLVVGVEVGGGRASVPASRAAQRSTSSASGTRRSIAAK